MVKTHYTVRSTKSGTRTTTRTKSGNTTITRTSGAGKKPRTTISTRLGKATYTRSTWRPAHVLEELAMLNSHLRFTTVAGLLAISFWMMLLTNVATANDFMEKRECTLQLPTRAPVHTTCVVQGGISNGSLDVAV